MSSGKPHPPARIYTSVVTRRSPSVRRIRRAALVTVGLLLVAAAVFGVQQI